MNEIHEADKKLRVVPSTVEEFVEVASFNEVQMGVDYLTLNFNCLF